MISPRPYSDDSDYFRLRRFLQRSRPSGPTPGCLFHVGDITWQRFMYTRDVFPPEERIALWERPDGELHGFAWYYPKWTEAALQIDPALRGTPEWAAIADSMLAWADDRYRADALATKPVSISELESDTDFAAYIASRGFARGDAAAMRYHERSLLEPIPESVLQNGFTVRSIEDEGEYEQRVEIHREVWAPSKFTVEGYRQLRSSPGYDPELDLVAVAPDGTFAAYTICWHDEIEKSGEFEPVGAREQFRGRGLTKAVLYEGMRRLRARGCTTAYVYSFEDNPQACGLYLSVGFEIRDRWVSYQKEN